MLDWLDSVGNIADIDANIHTWGNMNVKSMPSVVKGFFDFWCLVGLN